MCEDKTYFGADGGICPDQRDAQMTSPLCRGKVAWIGVGIHCRLARGLQSAIVSAAWKLPPSLPRKASCSPPALIWRVSLGLEH